MNKSPWSEETVQMLKKYQENPYIHPYTCGTPKCRQILIPTKDGWICPDCNYTQDWY